MVFRPRNIYCVHYTVDSMATYVGNKADVHTYVCIHLGDAYCELSKLKNGMYERSFFVLD